MNRKSFLKNGIAGLGAIIALPSSLTGCPTGTAILQISSPLTADFRVARRSASGEGMCCRTERFDGLG